MDDAIKQGVKGNVESSKQAIGSDKLKIFGHQGRELYSIKW